MTDTKGEKDNMVKSISQIQIEMETIKLIKEALDVDGLKAQKLLTEWTAPEEKKAVTLTGSGIGEPTLVNSILDSNVDGGRPVVPHWSECVLGRKEVEEMIASIDSAEKLKEVSTIVINVNLEKDQSAEGVADKLVKAIKNRGGKI